VSAAYPVPASYQTVSSYDSSDQLVATTAPATAAAPGGATTSYTYNQAGTLASSTNPRGVTATMTYNSIGLLTGMSYSGAAAPSVTDTYDAQRNLIARTDGTGHSSYSYDPFGEITSFTDGAGQTVGYSYDADGDTYPLPAAATWASSDTVGYGYDENDRLSSATDFSGQQITINNNSDDLPGTESLGSTGDTLAYSYDQADTISSIALANSTSTLQGFGYADAPDAEIQTETDTPSGTQSPASYAYDAQGRVTSMTPGASSPLNYGYDASGSLTTLPSGATASYDHASELTSSSLGGTSISYSYDADGDRTAAQQGSTTVAAGNWNGVDELTAYSDAAGSMSGASYDAAGLRASDTVTPAGGSAASQQFTWDASHGDLLMDSQSGLDASPGAR
jgi:YD repeat-containing protein